MERGLTLAHYLSGIPTGNLFINGGYVSSNGSSIGEGSGAAGNATVTSGTWDNSDFVRVGVSGTGTLDIDGGHVSSSVGLLIGAATTGVGSVTVSSGSWSSSGNVSVGDAGMGSLTVSGGSVVNVEGYVGLGVSSKGDVIMSGGTWSNSGDLTAGYFGNGNTLAVENGGTVFSENGVIGLGHSSNVTWGSNNTVTLSGQSSTWTSSGSLSVGVYGSNNTLTINDSGLVKVGDVIGETISFSTLGGSNNFLRLDGGYIALFGDQTTHINDLLAAGLIQLWDGSSWVSADGSERLSVEYYAPDASGEAAAEEAIGYSDLGGYTVTTVQAVPEPGTWALLTLGAAALFLLHRRKTCV